MLARANARALDASRAKGLRVAIVGSPNVGKSTLFTRLTRQVAHIANWPGTTVERKEGLLRAYGRTLVLVDTPGVYSLSGVSVEERVTRDYLLKGDWDVVLVLVDSLAPERTLYLALHVLEITSRVVVALTKWDAAHARGVHIHVDELERALGVPVVPVSAVTGEGLDRLVREILRVSERREDRPLKLDYGLLEGSIAELERLIKELNSELRAPPRWVAIKLLEGDELTAEIVRGTGAWHILQRAEELRRAAQALGRDAEEITVSTRYSFVDAVCRKAVVRLAVEKERGMLERLLLHPIIGPLLSVCILFSLYLLVFTLNTGFPLNAILEALGMAEVAEALEGHTLSGLISSLFDSLAAWVGSLALPSAITVILTEGVVPGLSLVVSFLPLIFTALLVLSFLEDSGIGPYAAASLHRFLQKLGVSGRAVYPMLISVGCNVPAVLSVRTMPEETERKQLYAAIPFIPCQARLVVLLAFASAFFAGEPLLFAGSIALAYIASFALSAITSLIARRAHGIREPPELILELPPLHLPSLRVLWWITWDYTKHYLKRAGMIIFGLSFLLLFLNKLGPTGLAERPEQSLAYAIGSFLSPLMTPLGLGGEKARILAFAMVSGLLAKEVVVLSIATFTQSSDPLEALASLALSRGQALSLMVLFSTYMPCAATVATLYRETRSVNFTLRALAWSMAMAVSLSYLLHALLLLFGLG